VIEQLAGERIHPSWIVPGGVAKPLDSDARDEILTELPHAKAIATRTLGLFKGLLDRFSDEVANFGCMPSMYGGLVDPLGNLQIYDGALRFRNADGTIAAEGIPASDYAKYIAEATLADSYLKAPYYKPHGYPAGMYRVGPLARLNVADRAGTPMADAELAEFRQRFGPVPESSFLYHYARLIEVIYALERIRQLLETPGILDTQVRAQAGVNGPEGIGVIEAPRGILIHHYKVDGLGAIRWVNLIVATGHNNLAMSRGVEQVSRKYVNGNRLEEGMLNRVSAVVRAFDPCMSCSTHAGGIVPLRIQLIDAGGSIVDELRT
jgi:NAD-reducing hydrogenase large subunit